MNKYMYLEVLERLYYLKKTAAIDAFNMDVALYCLAQSLQLIYDLSMYIRGAFRTPTFDKYAQNYPKNLHGICKKSKNIERKLVKFLRLASIARVFACKN